MVVWEWFPPADVHFLSVISCRIVFRSESMMVNMTINKDVRSVTMFEKWIIMYNPQIEE